jgi:hypothetical protein
MLVREAEAVACHHAEVPASAAAQRPEQAAVVSRVLERHRLGLPRFRHDDVGGDERVTGQAILPADRPPAAALREPADVHVGTAAAREHTTLLPQRRIDIFQPRAGADPDDGRVSRVGGDPVHFGDVDHQHAVAGAHAFVLMPARSNAHGPPVGV